MLDEQCACKAQVNLLNIRSDTSASVDGIEMNIPAGIYVQSVSENPHCCPFGRVGGSFAQRRGVDGLPVHE
jgi:hypothetical protein